MRSDAMARRQRGSRRVTWGPPRPWERLLAQCNPRPISPPGPGRLRRSSLTAETAIPLGEHFRTDATARAAAVLFLAREPLGARRIVQLTGLANVEEARQIIHALNHSYDAAPCAFRVVEVAEGFQLRTRSVFAPWLRRLYRGETLEVRLSPPALETLAVVAYRQPVVRAQVEAIRGVRCGEILRQLMDRELVRISGRSDELGRPFLYGTTRRFLQVFGLQSLEDLPDPSQIATINRESPAPAVSTTRDDPRKETLEVDRELNDVTPEKIEPLCELPPEEDAQAEDLDEEADWEAYEDEDVDDDAEAEEDADEEEEEWDEDTEWVTTEEGEELEDDDEGEDEGDDEEGDEEEWEEGEWEEDDQVELGDEWEEYSDDDEEESPDEYEYAYEYVDVEESEDEESDDEEGGDDGEGDEEGDDDEYEYEYEYEYEEEADGDVEDEDGDEDGDEYEEEDGPLGR